jgi:uncharacterized protein (DUF2062 family)
MNLMNSPNATNTDREWVSMLFNRRFRYIYLRLIRLRGHPHELALGMAFGIFTGMMPIIPFHTIVAVSLSLVFKASKITAAAGVWICNPVTIYLVYKYCYRIGSFILGFDENTKIVGPAVEALNHGELLDVVAEILSAGGMVAAAFLLGGIVLGIIFAPPSYFIFFYLFKAFVSWRTSRKLSKA